jgi:hypothetical protein
VKPNIRIAPGQPTTVDIHVIHLPRGVKTPLSLVRLAAEIDWEFLAGRFGSVCRVGQGQPPLPTRLVAGLLILKHMHNLSDEALCDRWVRTRISSISAGKWCSSTRHRSIARR